VERPCAEPPTLPYLAKAAGADGCSPHGRVTSSLWGDLGTWGPGCGDARFLRGTRVLGRPAPQENAYHPVGIGDVALDSSELPPTLRVEAAGDLQGVHGQHRCYEHRQRVGIQVADSHGETTPPLSVMQPHWVAVGDALPSVSAQHQFAPLVEAQEGHGLPAEDQGDSGELVVGRVRARLQDELVPDRLFAPAFGNAAACTVKGGDERIPRHVVSSLLAPPELVPAAARDSPVSSRSRAGGGFQPEGVVSGTAGVFSRSRGESQRAATLADAVTERLAATAPEGQGNVRRLASGKH
jgi:hypothetical protein